MRSFISILVFSFFAGVFYGSPAHAKERVDIIVPTTPGTSPDLIARVIADSLNNHDYQAIVKNVPGAAGEIAIRSLLKPSSNVLKLLLTQNSTVVINPHIHDRQEKELWKYAYPISFIGRHSSNFVIIRDEQASSLSDFINQKIRDGGVIKYASTGIGSFPHFMLEEILFRHANVESLNVPYRGASEAIQGLLGGDVDVVISGSAALPMVTAGRLRAVAVLGDKTSPLLPSVPPLTKEYPGLTLSPWFALFGNMKMSRTQMLRIRQVIQNEMGNTVFRDRLQSLGVENQNLSESATIKEMERDYDFFKKSVGRLKIKVTTENSK